MKEMKRILSLVLCAVMLIGYIPTSALAAEGEAVTEPAATEVVVETTEAVVETTEAIIETTETVVETTEEVVETTEETVPETTPVVKPVMMGMISSKKEATGEGADNNATEITTGSDTDTDYLFIATDRHANTSVIGNIINNMESVIGENELDYLGLGGDMVGSGNTHPEYDSSEVLTEVTNATSSLNADNVDIVAGIHDMNVTDDAGIVLPYQGGGAKIYEGTKFYVYGVEEYCISEDSDESNWSSEAQKFVTWANGSSIDKSKAIIVVSHYPLHAKRDDNDGAYYWHQALNTVATGSATGTEVIRDIVFFHGHNHTEDSNEYVYDVGDTMSIQSGSSTVSDTIRYTYATAGYLNQNKKATLVTIDADKISLTKYGTSGSGTAMTTVKRVSGEVTPTKNTVPCDTTYVDGYGVTQSDGNRATAVGLGLTGITVTQNDDVALTGFVEADTIAYDVALTGYTENDEVTLTFDLYGWETTDLVIYKVTENGNVELTPVSAPSLLTEDGLSYVSITVTQSAANATYIIGELAVAEGAVVESIAVTAMPTVTNYTLLVDNADDGNLYLDITGLEITATYDNGETDVIDWNQFDETKDGYALDFDLSTAGTKTVTVTYGGKETSFTVTVYEPNAVDADVAEYVSGVLAAGYIAKDINPANYETGTSIRVVMPAPEGANVVYHVAQDGTLTPIENPVFENGYVTFTTDSFSIYIAGVEVEDAKTATGSGTITTTEEKEVYVLVSAPTAGNQYIIVNRNTAGSGYALKENTTTGSSITVNAAGNGISAPYIETTDETIMWNTASGMTFQSENGGYYLRYNDGLSFSTSNSTDWTYSDSNTLYYRYSSSRYYYVYNSNGTWAASRYTSDEVYLYEKQSFTVETTTTANGTYSIAGNPAEVTKVVTSGTTATLGSTLTFTSEDGDVTTEDVSADATYTVVSGEDIITLSGNTATFTGAYGTAVVKVSYNITGVGEVTNYITVEATEPYYAVTIKNGDTDVTGTTVPVKGVTNTTTLQLSAVVSLVDEDGSEPVTVPAGATITWDIPEEYHGIATVDADGLITFKGVNGAFYVTATLTTDDGKDYVAGVNISATINQYTVPSDGPGDFPEYPNEGAIRFDKTATAVGNFSETGIAQIELSMTGVPYTTGSEIDVVLMLDMTGSMSDNGMEAAEEATKAFLAKIVKNEDGSYNNNRVAVYAFNSGSSSPYELVSLKSFSSDSELTTANTAIDTASDKQSSGGTPFDEAAAKCQSVLTAAKTDGIGNNRQQFCVFMSDGGPTAYRATYNNTNGYLDISNSGSGTSAITTYFSGYSSSSSSSWAFSLPTEYYTDQMKADGVTIYTVGLLLQNKPSNPSPYSSMTASTYDSTTDSLTTIGSHYYFTSRVLKQMASDESKYIDIFNVDNADKATAAFESIAKSILQAATDVTVEDKVDDGYTMIFDIPTGTKEITKVTNDFYIEFLEYQLNPTTHERTTSTSVSKLYLKVGTDGKYYAATDSTGTAYAAPVFENKTIGDKGTLYYWSTSEEDSKGSGISVVGADGNTYYFVPYGMKTAGYNMTSGGYASGSVNSETNMSEDVVIATPYYVYNAATKMLYWTVDKLGTTEYALRYFVYLDNSATEVGTPNEVPAASYPTNDYAYITYTNFNGTECQQEFPIPQLTWNGAQVSYVFYLVNTAGQPINQSGQIVDFANATFITDVQTTAVVWNKGLDDTAEGTSGELSADYLADDLLPDDYLIYDNQAGYELHVYENADGSTILNWFAIEGGTEAEIKEHLQAELTDRTIDNVSTTTTKVYNTKAGEKITGYGTYTTDETDEFENETVLDDFDFSNTTVAFAVVWEPTLVPDTFVVDYGLDVLLNVLENDLMQGNVLHGIGLGKDAYGDIQINTGVSSTSKLGTAALTTDVGHVISLEGERQIRFSQKDMTFEEPVTFYYETDAKFWKDSDQQTGYMYSSVTVIPATTIYYEDSFLTFEATNTTWTTEGQAVAGTQAQDRPGTTNIINVVDANNNYGYDSAYDTMSTYSMGSAHKITVTANAYGSATFTFYGTGFDIIGLTSNTTGSLIIDVYQGAAASGEKLKSLIVDTYYGYTKEDGEWVVDEDAANSLYQIPVMKVSGLDYGQYTVKLNAVYASLFDHQTNDGEYDLYLDAVRIYDPTGVVSGETVNDTDGVVSDAYIADGEGWPVYQELRNNLITASDYENGATNGILFIDGDAESFTVADYISYGPNNELYLAPEQAVVFSLDLADYVDSTTGESIVDKVQLGIKSADGGEVNYAIVDAMTITAEEDLVAAATNKLTTSTDMYYDMTDLKDKAIIIYNNGDGIMSLTNIKVTFTEKPTNVDDFFYVDGDVLQNILDKDQNVTPDTPADETETIEVTAKLPTKVKTGEEFDVLVTAPEDSVVMVNDVKAIVDEGAVMEIDGMAVYSATLTADDVDPNETAMQDIEIVATKGDASATLEGQVTVYNYAPEIQVAAADTVQAGSPLTITVTTGTDVEAVSIGGTLVTTYRVSETNRIWTLQMTWEEEDEYPVDVYVDVYAYSAEGYESEAETIEVTVTESTPTVATNLRNLVSSIAKTLLSWFKK